MSRLWKTIRHDSQTSTDFISNKRVETGVSERWLQYYVNIKFGAVKRKVEVKPKKKGQLTIQCDEMWSFVGNKDNKQWIWMAEEIPEIIDFDELHTFIGNKGNKLWIWTTVNHKQPGVLAWTIGDLSAETFKSWWRIVKCWQCFFYVTEGW